MKVFLSYRLYGVRGWFHFDGYKRGVGWYQLEIGSWSLELELGGRNEN